MDINILNMAHNQVGASQLDATRKAAQALPPRHDEMREAAETFEAIFISQMMSPMFESVETDGMFGGGHAEGMYRSMMVEHMATEVSRAGGVGIADHVYKQLLAIQEGQS